MSRLPKRGSLLRWLLEPEPPGLGLDLRAGEVALAGLDSRRSSPGLGLATTSPIAPGVVEFSMLTPNVLDEDELARTLDDLFLKAGVNAERIALTLPDYVARLSIVEVGEPPGSREETAELLKFRLKKSLPFDVERARLAFERLPGNAPSFLTGVMLEDVVSQYERLLERLGLHVGLVLPASVALLDLLKPVALGELAPGADYFLVNVERDYFSVTLVRDREIPTLIRTLGRRANGGLDYSEDDLLQEIIPTAIYYREKLEGAALERIYYRSLRPDFHHLRELLEEQFEAPTEPFNLKKSVAISKTLRMDAELAEAVGAAAGAAFGKVT